MSANVNFLSLPREIRDMVYEEAISQRQPTLIKYYGSKNNHRFVPPTLQFSLDPTDLANRLKTAHPPRKWNTPQGDGLNLLLANRQLHEECEPIFYSQPFHFADVESMLAFIFVEGSKASLISKVCLDVHPFHYRRYSGTRTSLNTWIRALVNTCVALALQRLTRLQDLEIRLRPDSPSSLDVPFFVEDLIRPFCGIPTLKSIFTSVTVHLAEERYLEIAQAVEKELAEATEVEYEGNRSKRGAQVAEENELSDCNDWNGKCLDTLGITWKKRKDGSLWVPGGGRGKRLKCKDVMTSKLFASTEGNQEAMEDH